MENKLEFLNSPVVPLYNWEQWDTQRNNWNYYKQYACAPTKDWNYKVWNVDNDVTHFGYKKATSHKGLPAYALQTVVPTYDSTRTYEQGRYIYKYNEIIAFGRDDGAWMYDIEDCYHKSFPTETVIPDAYKGKALFKKPKSNDIKTFTCFVGNYSVINLKRFYETASNNQYFYSPGNSFFYNNPRNIDTDYITHHYGMMLDSHPANYYTSSQTDLYYENKFFFPGKEVLDTWYEQRKAKLYVAIYDSSISDLSVHEVTDIIQEVRILRNPNTSALTYELKQIFFKYSPTIIGYIKGKTFSHCQPYNLDHTQSYLIKWGEASLDPSLYTFVYYKGEIWDKRPYSEFTAEEKTYADSLTPQNTPVYWDTTILYSFTQSSQQSGYYETGDILYKQVYSTRYYNAYVDYTVNGIAHSPLVKAQDNGNGEYQLAKLIKDIQGTNFSEYSYYTRVNGQTGNNGRYTPKSILGSDGGVQYTSQFITNQLMYDSNTLMLDGPDRVIPPENPYEDKFFFTPISAVGKKVFSSKFPDYIDYYVTDVSLAREITKYSTDNTLIYRNAYKFAEWIDLDDYNYIQPTTPEGIQAKTSLYPFYNGTYINRHDTNREYVIPVTNPIEDGYRYFCLSYAPHVALYIDNTDRVKPTLDNWPLSYEVQTEMIMSNRGERRDYNTTTRNWKYRFSNDVQAMCATTYPNGYNNETSTVKEYWKKQTAFNLKLPHFDEYVPIDKSVPLDPYYTSRSEIFGPYLNYAYDYTYSYDANGNITDNQTEARLESFGLINMVYMNLHMNITPQPPKIIAENPVDIFVTNVQIKDGYWANKYAIDYIRDRARDYFEPGAQRGSHYYGEIDYYKVANINRQDQLYKDYSFIHTKDNQFVTDYGANAKLNIPPTWLDAVQFLPVTGPVDGRHITTISDVTGAPNPVDTAIWIELQTETAHAAQPYQPLNDTRLSTAHYTEEPHVPETPHNYSRPNTNHTLWEVWDFAHYGGHPTTFIKYVESQNVNAYPSPNNPEYDPTTHTWTDGYQNGYWYWRKADTTTHQKTLYDKDLRDGVKLEHSINSASDYAFGTAAAASIQFNYYSTTDNASQYLNEPCAYYSKYGTQPYAIKGVFTVTDMNTKRNYTSFSGYDNMIFTDISASSFISGTTFPITAKQMFQNLCFYCDLTYDANCIQDTDSTQTATYFPSASHLINNNFTSANITARQVFSYLGEVLNCFFAISTSGKIYPGKYITTNISLDNEDYVEYTFGKYTINSISKVIIKADSSYGFVEGNDTGDTYFINNNPLLYAEQKSEVQDVLTNTLVALSNISYKPGTVKTLNDIGINVGDKITVDNNTFYVMKKTVTNSGTTYECLGNQNRQTGYDTQDTNIIALRGITQNLNDLTQTLDVDLTSIDTRFANVTGRVSTLAGQTEGNSREIDDLQTLTASHTNTLSNHGGRITSLEGRMTTAEGNISGHSTSINSINNTLNNHETRISANTWKSNQNAQDIATNTTDITVLKDQRPEHQAAVKNGYGTFISPSGIFYCAVNASKQPTQVIWYIDYTTGKTNLAITTDAWTGSIPSDIIW